jgi:hypothetical protein
MTYIIGHGFVDYDSVQVDVSQQKIFFFRFFFLYVLNIDNDHAYTQSH